MKKTYEEVLVQIQERKKELARQCEALLGETGNVVLEIGCGHGHFLTAYAEAHPDRLCVGIDILKKRIDRAEKKKDRGGLQNLFFVKAEAQEFLGALPQRIRIEEIFILFPDPWPKNRHHKNRLVRKELLDQLAKKTKPNARLKIRTDHEEYFQWMYDCVEEHPLWEITEDLKWSFEQETIFQQKTDKYQSLIALRVAG